MFLTNITSHKGFHMPTVKEDLMVSYTDILTNPFKSVATINMPDTLDCQTRPWDAQNQLDERSPGINMNTKFEIGRGVAVYFSPSCLSML